VIDEASSTITWETLVQQYREAAARDDARIDELRQSTEHWHDTAQMLMRQRNLAEEERDGWKERALKAEQGRQVNRDLLVIAEGQRDQAKMRAEAAEAKSRDVAYWHEAWKEAEAERDALRVECEALRTVDDAMVERAARATMNRVYKDHDLFADDEELLRIHREYARIALTAAMAVQPTTGETDE
jgi:hypothetical protein